MVEAAGYRLLIDAALIGGVTPSAEINETPVDLSRALGGENASVVIACDGAAKARYLGVDMALGLVDLADDDLVALPPMIHAAAGDDIDRMTRLKLRGAHAFRLRLDRSSAAAAM
jgi:hypothetical protein